MKPYYEEPNASLYQGHALDVLKGLSSESVDCAACSPPYWGLRTYKTEPQIWGDNHCEHEWGDLIPNPMVKSGKHGPASIVAIGTKIAEHAVRKESNQGNFCLKCNAWRGELGLEPTIELYIQHLLLIFNEVKRVLKKTGTCWVVIDDSYASGKGTCFNPGGGKGSFSGHGDRKDAGAYPLDRGNTSMLKAQGLLPKSLCLIPERFALAMVEQGWILRNNIVWAKPNPMPESVKDRFTGSWEHLFFFVKSQKYWFEQQLEPHETPNGMGWAAHGKGTQYSTSDYGPHLGAADFSRKGEGLQAMGGNPLGRNKRDVWEMNTEPSPIRGVHFATFPEKLVETPILAGCPQNGVVMDIFAGSGTTGAVAKRLGRKYIGIELSEEYCKLHIKRLQAVPLAMELDMLRGVTNG